MSKYSDFTDLGKQLIKESGVYSMDAYYDPYVGNFGFTELEMYRNINNIKAWLETHKDYFLLYQDGYENGKCWWLTTDF